MKNSQKSLHVGALAIGGDGENLPGFLPESPYSGPAILFKTSGRTRASRTCGLGRWIPRTLSLFLCVSIV